MTDVRIAKLRPAAPGRSAVARRWRQPRRGDELGALRASEEHPLINAYERIANGPIQATSEPLKLSTAPDRSVLSVFSSEAGGSNSGLPSQLSDLILPMVSVISVQ